MRMFSRRAVGYLVMTTSLALALTGPSLAQSQGQENAIRDAKQLVESLRSGGYVVLVRHGATFTDQADTAVRQVGIPPAKSTQAISIVPSRRRYSPDLTTSKRPPT